MLTLKATVINVFKSPVGRTREGKSFGGEDKVQLQGLNELRNGEKRAELFTLTTKNPESFRKRIGEVVEVPVGAFGTGHGIQFFLVESN